MPTVNANGININYELQENFILVEAKEVIH